MQEIISEFLIQYQLPALFAGAVLFGETIILTAAFLSAQGWWSLSNIFFVTLLGTVVSDVIWFLLGNKILKTKKFQKHEKKYKKLIHKIDSKIGNRPYLSLLVIKFLYGTRILTIIYLSFRKIKLWQFVVFDVLGTSFWLIVLLLIGYWAGRGYGTLIDMFHNIGYGLSALLLFFIVYRLINVWINKKIVQK